MIPRSVQILLLLCLLPGVGSNLTASPHEGVFFETQHMSRYRDLFTGNPLFATLREQMDTLDRARERTFLRSGVRYNDHLFDIARLVGTSSSGAGVTCTVSLPDIPSPQAILYPCADVATVQPGIESCLVTVLLPSASGGAIGSARISRDGPVYAATVSAGARSISVRVIDSGEVPEFQVGEE